MQHRGGYHGGPPMQHQMRHRFGPMAPNSITSVYQGVAAKIGTGIIDDPLEAFNRIMREKERRKEERRASPPIRRRSRSNEPRRRSPLTDRRRSPPIRVRSPDMRRRSPERRGRSPRSEERRRKRSHSYDTRLSRSFSRYDFLVGFSFADGFYIQCCLGRALDQYGDILDRRSLEKDHDHLDGLAEVDRLRSASVGKCLLLLFLVLIIFHVSIAAIHRIATKCFPIIPHSRQ